jgi:mannonate dehydratase
MIRMALGQFSEPTDEWLDYAAQLGCSGVVIHHPFLPHPDGYWLVDDLVAMRKAVEAKGLKLVSVENTEWPMYMDAMVGGPDRDKQIEAYCQTVRNLGAAGIDVLGFCWMPNSVWSTSFDGVGRGGSKVRYFDLEQHLDAPLTHGREIGEEEMWDNFSRFINAVAPVAEEAGVRLALHPDDPPVESLGGIARIFRSQEAFRRATEEICPSPAFGLNFCMGSWSEQGPGKAVEAMRYFAERNRIVYVHFRDVIGSVPKFEECFIGDGNVDPVEALRILGDAGFDGYMIDDHVPRMDGDETIWAHRGRAWSTGYILGMLRALQGNVR